MTVRVQKKPKNMLNKFEEAAAQPERTRPKSTQKWLEEKVADSISANDCPSLSPDHNSLDYKIWSVVANFSL
ncbi:hypothetical protein Trydic_g16626 [Trypoxylus dichotomus]